MKYYADMAFRRSGESFAERVGDPTESDAAVGRIALGFSFLEDTAANLIVLFSGAEMPVGTILAAELAFRQKVDVLASLVRYRIAGTVHPDAQQELQERADEQISLCRKAEDLRNSYLHSSYGGEVRARVTAKARHGLRFQVEPADSALLLDVADFIVSVGMELENLPMLLGVADSVSSGPRGLEYRKGEDVIATFRLGECGSGPTSG